MATQRVARAAGLGLAAAATTVAAIIIALQAVTTEEPSAGNAPARLERTYGPVVLPGARLEVGRRGKLTFCYRIRVMGHPGGSTCASAFFEDGVSALVYSARGRGTFVGGVVGDLVDHVSVVTTHGETVAAPLQNRAFLVRLPRGGIAAEVAWVLDDGTQRVRRIRDREA